MPPKQRITREMILERSFDMFCKDGMDVVNARSVAKALNCSTQPIFSYFAGMQDLKDALEIKAKETFETMLAQVPRDKDPLVDICTAIVAFAYEQPCLFKHLFMRSKNGPKYSFLNGEELLEIERKEGEIYQLDSNRAHDALVHMSIYAHGYASLLAGGQLESESEKIGNRIVAAHKYLIAALRKEL